MKPLALASLATFAVGLSAHLAAAQALTRLVNLFIGTESGANGGSGGNAFPGAAVPHGMVKVGIDVNPSSSEYSFFAPHSMATLVELMGGNTTFVNRVDHYFDTGRFLAGNEPGFAMPLAYHYTGSPALSALRMRNVVYTNFNTGIGGIPGNDDSGAMAALLVFHILDLYPVPSSRQLLLNSPLLSSFTLHNPALGTTTSFTVSGFNKTALGATVPAGARVYVTGVSVNGVQRDSVCWIGFEDVVGGGEVVMSVDADAAAEAEARGCGSGEGALPDSLATGGFSV